MIRGEEEISFSFSFFFEEEISKAIPGATDLGVSAADSTDGESGKGSGKVGEIHIQNSTSTT